VKEFVHLEDSAVYNALESEGPLGRIWALVDANKTLCEPPLIFQRGPFFVVEASSPRPMNREWTEGISHKFFYMKGWPFSEVLQA
jgi:hypothetical protein